jgi:nitrate/nitrite transporter NarK
MALGIYLLYSGPNTGIFFQINLGLLVGIGLGGTAISVQIAEVGKHFPNQTRGLAIGIVVATASIGYFFLHCIQNLLYQHMAGKRHCRLFCILLFLA